MQFKIKEMKGKAACEQLSKQDNRGALPGTAVRGFGQLSPKGEPETAAALRSWGSGDGACSTLQKSSCHPNPPSSTGKRFLAEQGSEDGLKGPAVGSSEE